MRDQLADFPIVILLLWLVHGHYVAESDLVALGVAVRDEEGAELDELGVGGFEVPDVCVASLHS